MRQWVLFRFRDVETYPRNPLRKVRTLDRFSGRSVREDGPDLADSVIYRYISFVGWQVVGFRSRRRLPNDPRPT